MRNPNYDSFDNDAQDPTRTGEVVVIAGFNIFRIIMVAVFEIILIEFWRLHHFDEQQEKKAKQTNPEERG